MAILLKRAAWALLTLLVVLLGAGQAGLLAGTPPGDLGVRDGRLAPPSPTPNSVSSQAPLYPDHPQRDGAAIAPLRYSGDADQALQRLRQLVAASERTRITVQDGDYLRAEAESRWLRFRDDLEFWLDRQAGVIHVRSASRLGRKDFGVNRARVERLRQQFGG